MALGMTVMFFRKSRWAPRLMMGLIALNALANVFVVAALVWIRYFLASKRVKATFTE